MKTVFDELVAEWRATAKRYSDYAAGMGLSEAMSKHYNDRADELENALRESNSQFRLIADSLQAASNATEAPFRRTLLAEQADFMRSLVR